MISRIIDVSVRHRWLVILAWGAIALWGIWALLHTPVDAIPDLSENQVIVFADWPGRSPQDIEDQVTHPLSVALQDLAMVKVVRASSEFGFSMINVIFEDRADPYFARQRVLEKLIAAKSQIPADVTPSLAADATALGQIFWYTVEGGGLSLDQLRAIQDFNVRYALSGVSGVAEVASVGGQVREYHVDVDPLKLRLLNLPLSSIYAAVAQSNLSVGGKVIATPGSEYVLRGVGWLHGGEAGIADLENLPLLSRGGVALRLSDVARVQLGPAFRRSALEKDAHEAVGGVVIMRLGQNPLAVTRAVEEKIRQIQPGLPAGVRIVPFYQRTRLIDSAIDTVTGALREEILIASIAILLILTHLRSAIVVCITLPLAVLVSFLFMHYLDIPSNIMSLSGIAISIGILVDASVVMVENATHELKERFGDAPVTGDTSKIVIRACRTVGGPIFFSVVIMLVSFLPVFVFGGQEGKLSHPLAFTKSFAMVGVALMAITLVPALIPILVRGRLSSEDKNRIVRGFIDIYRPLLSWAIERPGFVWWLTASIVIVGIGFIGSETVMAIGVALAVLSVMRGVRQDGWTRWVLLALVVGLLAAPVSPLRWTLPLAALAMLLLAMSLQHWRTSAVTALLVLAFVAQRYFPKLGGEFMPELDEGSIMDMPITAPRVPMAEAVDDVMVRDRVLRGLPESESVVGKIGRADTATDPSPLDMVETMVELRPTDQWPRRSIHYDDALALASQAAVRMQQRHWLGGTPLDAAGWLKTDLLDRVTQQALVQFDRDQCTLARQRQEEYRPHLGHELIAAAFTHFINHVLSLPPRQGQSALLHSPSDAEFETVAASCGDLGLHLADMPQPQEVDQLLQVFVQQCTRLGIVAPRDDLLLNEPGPLVQAWNSVRSVAGWPAPAFSDQLFAMLQEGHHHLWARQTAQMNWELHDVGLRVLSDLLVRQLAQTARSNMTFHAMPPDDAQLGAVSGPLASSADHLLLWQKSRADLVAELNTDLQMPGWGNIWTQPIINRVNMLATGVRTQIGVKVFGPVGKPLSAGALDDVQRVSEQIAAALRKVDGAVDVEADQSSGKRYLEVSIDRDRALRWGVSATDVAQAVQTALGGAVATTTIEGSSRFAVQVRLAASAWQDPDRIGDIPIPATTTPAATTPPTLSGQPADSQNASRDGDNPIVLIPLRLVATISAVEGPSMIKSEDGRLRNYVTLNVRGRDPIGFVAQAQQAIAPIERSLAGTGMSIEWTGEYENQLHARQTLTVIFPIVILIIALLLYITFNDALDMLLVMLAVVGALAGAVTLQAMFGFNFSVIAAIGYIAAFGMATQTGVIMLVYLREALARRGGLSDVPSLAVLRQAVIDGAVHRLRPKLLTEGVAIVGLVPMLWATGVASQIMRPMAAPVLGGLLISDEVIDLMIPVLFYWIRRRRWLEMNPTSQAAIAEHSTPSGKAGARQEARPSRQPLSR